MPRYKKPRQCNCTYEGYSGTIYKPVGIPMTELLSITIYRDELESMRLCDLEDLSQVDAGNKMGISRGTVQRLLTSARKKVVRAIVERKALNIEKEPNLKLLEPFSEGEPVKSVKKKVK